MDTENGDNNSFWSARLPIIVLAVGILGLWFSYSSLTSQELSVREKELQIKEETYISTLLDRYNRDLQSCFSAVGGSQSLTRDVCIERINDSRTANLLREWGHSDSLVQKEAEE